MELVLVKIIQYNKSQMTNGQDASRNEPRREQYKQLNKLNKRSVNSSHMGQNINSLIARVMNVGGSL